jgi:LPS export ABC transporter protein LptC
MKQRVMKRAVFSILLFILLIFSTGCSLDYEEGTIADDISEDIPNLVLFEVEQTVVSKGVPTYHITAERAETFEKRNTTILYNVLFQELDEEGEVITEGWADHVVFHTDTDNAELTGELSFYSSEEEAQIDADYLEWNDETQTLKGRPNEDVTIREKSGSHVSGTGFVGEFSEKRVEFSGASSGEYIDEDEEEEGEPREAESVEGENRVRTR